MRRLLIVVGLLGVAGCSNFRDLFSAHADVAAKAGDLELKTTRMAQILAGPKGAQLNRESADFVANLWTDYALFSQAVATRKLPSDSAAIAEVLWGDIAELRSQHWFDTLLARRGKVTPARIDSAYNGNAVRLLQHMLFSVTPNAVPEERAAARRKAEAALARVKAGADFGQLASQMSADPGSARDQGYLGVWPRGKFVTAFDSAGWALSPGAVSAIVETPFGYHIIRRPPESAVIDRFTAWIHEGAGVRIDSLYLDSLAITKKIKVASSAPATLRSAVEDMEGSAGSSKAVATYDGGTFTLGEMVKWMHQIVPPAAYPQVKAATDSQLIQFARGVTSSALLLRQADSAHIVLSPVEWQEMHQQYAAQIDSLKMEMGISGADFADSSIARNERVKVAGLKLAQYFDALLAGKARLRPLPTTLTTLLRERMTHKIYPAGLERGLGEAQAIRAKSDSINGPTGPRPGMPPGAMQPAPGPPPSGGTRTPPPVNR